MNKTNNLVKPLTLAVLAASMASTSAMAMSFTYEPMLEYQILNYKANGKPKLETNLAVLGLEIETADSMNNFHRLKVSGSLYDKEESNYGADVNTLNFSYKIGKFFYPEAEPTDFSMWTGIGYKDIDVEYQNEKNKDKLLHIPLGMEYAFPIDNRGAWPHPLSVQRNHKHFVVLGAEYQFIVHGEGYVGNNTWRGNNGQGFKVWLGYDYRLSDSKILTASFNYEAFKIKPTIYEDRSKGKGSIDSDTLSFKLGLRFR